MAEKGLTPESVGFLTNLCLVLDNDLGPITHSAAEQNLAIIEAMAIRDFLASPEAERELAAAAYKTALTFNGWPDAKAILHSWREARSK